MDSTLEARGFTSVPWGAIAIAAAVLSAVGYACQTILDYVSLPADITRLVFFGFFEWDGLLALLTGTIAVLVGWKKDDATVRLGTIAIGYVILAQTIQILWD